ncbi:MAG: HAD-IA family hydrolase, partial [Pseudomonadota bacterium]
AHDDLVAAYKVHYRDAMVREALAEPLYPGVMEMLDAVSTEATLLGVATGKSRHGLNRILESHQLKGRFVTTVTADEAASKPAPEMVEIALKASGAERAKTVVIGDSTFDIVMARAAGVRAIGVSWGYQSPEELRAAGAHAIAERMDEIAPLAAKLVGP